MIDEELQKIMACPFCKGDLKFSEQEIACLNKECGCVYAIQDGIPVMLIDEAKRPCPKCGAKRDWNEDVLQCPKCGTKMEYHG